MSFRKLINRIPLWIREAVIMVALGAVILWVAGVIQRDGQRGAGGDGAGAEAPAFALADVRDGQVWQLEKLRGKPVILSFWATWCGACRAELPELEAFWRQVDSRYFVVTISGENPQKLKEFSRRMGLTLPIANDLGGQVSAAYGVTVLPTTVIIDAEGRISRSFAGAPHVDILEEHMRRLGAPARAP